MSIDQAAELSVGLSYSLALLNEMGRLDLVEHYKPEAERLEELLKRPEIGGPLSLANPMPCQVGGVVAESYAAAVAACVRRSRRPEIDFTTWMHCAKEYERATGRPCNAEPQAWEKLRQDRVGEPRLPVVRMDSDPPEVEFNGTVYQVTGDQALAINALVRKHPERVGMASVIGDHPERKLNKLPAELKAIIDTTNKGTRFII